MQIQFARLTVFVVVLVATRACCANEQLTEISGPTMGTSYHIKLLDVRDPSAIQAQVDERLAEINALMSTYISDSEVSRFNRAAADQWFSISAETLKVIELAQSISRQTQGAFDITVGPLVRLWNFGSHAEPGTFSPPDEKEIRTVLQAVGYEKLEIQQDPPALRKTIDGLEIDLSAIAKGYAVDQIAELLLGQQVTDFMVEIGGEVRVAGLRPDGNRWRIGIESPEVATRRVETVLGLDDQALASSGDYRNYHEHDGKRYSHTIDPRTGRPVEHELASASVVSDNCATADALATALVVMGPNEGTAWAEQHDVASLLISRGESGFEYDQTSHLDAPIVDLATTEPTEGFGGIFLASVILFLIALSAMSVGVMFGRKRIQGSCGGLAGLKNERGETLCQACSNPSPTCRNEPSGADRQAIGASSGGTSELK